MSDEQNQTETTAAGGAGSELSGLVMQLWLDDQHGRVTGGPYDGNLLRAGVCDGPYIDILMPRAGWQRLDQKYHRNDEDPEKLVALKLQVDKWLAA